MFEWLTLYFVRRPRSKSVGGDDAFQLGIALSSFTEYSSEPKLYRTSTQMIPKTMRALITLAKGSSAIKEIPVPTIDDDEVLVKVIAVAQNPTDWQYIDVIGNPDTICGVDYAGVVVEVGANVASLAVGDKVAGFTQGGNYTDRGAYAEYVKTSADLAWKIPEGTLTFEEASTYGCAFWTSVQALFHPDRLGMVEPPQRVQHEEWVFIYGGSSSVGMYSLQLAHLAGYRTVTVASPKNWDLCRTLGADAVFDYKDPDVVSKIKEVTGGGIHLAFDTISQLGSQTLTMQTMAPGAGKIIVIQPPQAQAEALRNDVTIQHVLIYTSLGREFNLAKHYPAAPEDRVHMANFLTKVPDLVRAGCVQPNPIKLWRGGLDAVNDGLQYMREGRNSGEKIVYRIAA